MAIPSTLIPSASCEAVASVKNLGAFDSTEAHDREERGSLHLDHHAAFTSAPRLALGVRRHFLARGSLSFPVRGEVQA